ncbi:MAG: MBL fold metallo-hydrolase [Pseudohongiellaceae bacterium]
MSEFIVGQAIHVAGQEIPVRRVLAPNAGPMTGAGTNSYLLGKHRFAMIDPGPADAGHVARLLEVLGSGKLDWILVTHTHGDHSPAASMLRERTGAALIGLAPPKAEHNDATFTPDRHFRHGEVLDCGEFRLELIHTPGHVSNHFCYLLQEEGILFTGDHILEGTTSVILPPDGDMGHYMDSLHRLLDYPLQALAPGHGRIMLEPRSEIIKLIRHRQQRELKVINALARLGETDLEALTLAVYDDVAPHLLFWARRTLLAHLLKLQRENRTAESSGGWKLLTR